MTSPVYELCKEHGLGARYEKILEKAWRLGHSHGVEDIQAQIGASGRVAVLEESQRLMRAELDELLDGIVEGHLDALVKSSGVPNIEQRNRAAEALIELVGSDVFTQLLKERTGAGSGQRGRGLSAVGDGSTFLRSTKDDD